MKRTQDLLKHIFVALILALSFTACIKEEFVPPPVGEAIPFVDSATATFAEVLATSPYTLFYEAWQRSNIEAILVEEGHAKSQYTVLAPNNAALGAAGWDQAAILSASQEELDDLLTRYIFLENISEEVLRSRLESYPAVSLHVYPGLRYAGSRAYSAMAYDVYRFQAKISLAGDQLLVNGQVVGTPVPIATAEGYIWPIERSIEPPTRTAWEVLQADGRFSLYVQLLERSDAEYHAIFERENGYPPSQGHAYARVYDRSSIQRYQLDYAEHGYYGTYIPRLSTWFVPTDEAFQRAGFDTIEELEAFYTNGVQPRSVWWPARSVLGVAYTGFYQLEGELSTDSLLDYHHNWGRRYVDFLTPSDTTTATTTWFYSNDLTSQLLDNYPIDITSGGVVRAYYFPFDIQSDVGGTLQFRIKETNGEAATLADRDINTLNGVIHAVDRLFVPPGFLFD